MRQKIERLAEIFSYIGKESERLARSWHLMEMFSALRKTDGRLTWENETNRYQVELRMLYAEWMDDLVLDMEEFDQVVEEIIDASIFRLETQLVTLSRQRIFEGYDLGFGAGKVDYTTDIVGDLASIMVQNEEYIEQSLIPDVRARIREAMSDPKFILLGVAFLIDQLGRMGARLEMYAGAEWKAINKGVGAYARANNLPVYWSRDSLAKHCASCLDFGEQEYASFDDLLAITGGVLPADGTICRGNCRCSLLVDEGDGWVRP